MRISCPCPGDRYSTLPDELKILGQFSIGHWYLTKIVVEGVADDTKNRIIENNLICFEFISGCALLSLYQECHQQYETCYYGKFYSLHQLLYSGYSIKKALLAQDLLFLESFFLPGIIFAVPFRKFFIRIEDHFFYFTGGGYPKGPFSTALPDFYREIELMFFAICLFY
jgi:hypothetical protein